MTSERLTDETLRNLWRDLSKRKGRDSYLLRTHALALIDEVFDARASRSPAEEAPDPRDADLAVAPVATAAMIESAARAEGFREGVSAAARLVANEARISDVHAIALCERIRSLALPAGETRTADVASPQSKEGAE